MKNSTIIRVVIFGSLAIISIIGVQTYWVMNSWNVEEREFHDRATMALMNVAKEFEKIGNQLPAYDLVNRVTSNYYVVNINDVINASNLEFFLRREIEAAGLTEDFEYGIYDCANNKMVYRKYISYKPDADTSLLLKKEMPIHDDFTYYFGVRFPSRTSHILSNMGATIIFSGILLGTVLFFLYSIFVILRQKRLSEMQKDFINNMTHEFKTPISTIKISADVFLNDPHIQGDDRLHQYAGIIREQNTRLNKQVEKVLQLAKIERENFRLSTEEVDLHALLKKVVPGIRLKVEELGGSLDCQLHAPSAMVQADPMHLSNVLHNLLDNSVKYCRDVPRISIQTRQTQKQVELIIADQGIGMDKEHQTKVFKKFYRVPTGNVHNVKGFGLGLYYIKNICNAHGWKIELESDSNKGTAFHIFMPQAKKHKSKWSLNWRKAALS